MKFKNYSELIKSLNVITLFTSSGFIKNGFTSSANSYRFRLFVNSNSFSFNFTSLSIQVFAFRYGKFGFVSLYKYTISKKSLHFILFLSISAWIFFDRIISNGHTFISL